MDLDDETRTALGWGEADPYEVAAVLTGRLVAVQTSARARVAEYRVTARGKATRREREATPEFRAARNAKLRAARVARKARQTACAGRGEANGSKPDSGSGSDHNAAQEAV